MSLSLYIYLNWIDFFPWQFMAIDPSIVSFIRIDIYTTNKNKKLNVFFHFEWKNSIFFSFAILHGHHRGRESENLNWIFLPTNNSKTKQQKKTHDLNQSNNLPDRLFFLYNQQPSNNNNNQPRERKKSLKPILFLVVRFVSVFFLVWFGVYPKSIFAVRSLIIIVWMTTNNNKRTKEQANERNVFCAFIMTFFDFDFDFLVVFTFDDLVSVGNFYL